MGIHHQKGNYSSRVRLQTKYMTCYLFHRFSLVVSHNYCLHSLPLAESRIAYGENLVALHQSRSMPEKGSRKYWKLSCTIAFGKSKKERLGNRISSRKYLEISPPQFSFTHKPSLQKIWKLEEPSSFRRLGCISSSFSQHHWRSGFTVN